MYYLWWEKMFSVVISLYIDAIFFLNFWPVYTFGVHWVAECGGGESSNFSLSLSWCVERKILIPPLHLVNREPSSLTLFQKRELVTELVRRRTITEQAYIQIEFYTAERGGTDAMARTLSRPLRTIPNKNSAAFTILHIDFDTDSNDNYFFDGM